MSPTPPAVTQNGFERALKGFQARLTSSERAQFDVATLDDLKVTILTIQAEQRARKGMMHMGRIQSFLEAMEQFGKVIEVFLNTANMLAFVWGPIKLLLLVCLFRPAIPLGVIWILLADARPCILSELLFSLHQV
jgi:hypothetical protein